MQGMDAREDAMLKTQDDERREREEIIACRISSAVLFALLVFGVISRCCEV
jgi:hypothetical protein